MKKDDAKGNVKFGEGAEHFAQVGVHDGLVGQSGKVVDAAASAHGLVVGIGPGHGELAFEGLNDADDGAATVTQWDGPGVHRFAMAGAVMNEAGSFHRFAVGNGGVERTFFHAHFAAHLIAVQKNVVAAGVAEHVDAGVAGDFFRAVAPEDDFSLQVDDTDADLK